MILLIKQIGLSLRGRPILLITRMITDRIGLLSPVTITNRFLFFHVPGCSGMSRHVPECSMFHVPGFIDTPGLSGVQFGL